MIEFQEKRRIKRMLYSKPVLLVLVILIGFLLNAVWNVYQKRQIAKDNYAKIADNLDKLQSREKILSAEIERLKLNEGMEEEIRERYGLVKPGEEVLVIVSDNKAQVSTSTSANTSLWQKIKNWLE
jgi:cell division protein FtsB